MIPAGWPDHWLREFVYVWRVWDEDGTVHPHRLPFHLCHLFGVRSEKAALR